MSWSLQISNGDLVFAGNGLGTVEGGAKLVQDLRCAILEPMGTDPMHTSFGSTIDGGILPDGTFQPGVIGTGNDAVAGAKVNAELRRIIAQYQAAQQDRYHSDVATYGKATLSADEVLMSVEDIQLTAAENKMLVSATLQTGAGSAPFNAPLSTS